MHVCHGERDDYWRGNGWDLTLINFWISEGVLEYWSGSYSHQVHLWLNEDIGKLRKYPELVCVCVCVMSCHRMPGGTHVPHATRETNQPYGLDMCADFAQNL